ncbi:MAG: hypothetical protein ABI395_02015, partial [Sphingobium sp.]
RGQSEREELTETVSVRRLNGSDMLLFDELSEKPMALTLKLIERVTGLDRVIVEKLDMEDVNGLGELLGTNMPNFPSIGVTG